MPVFVRRVALLVLIEAAAACSGAPPATSLRDSFTAQLQANQFVSDVRRDGDDITFRGPRPDGTPAEWRVHIDSAIVERQEDERQPYKGTVTSTWVVGGEVIEMSGSDSNLPIELTSNGLGQVCWAFWKADARHWSWE